VACLRQTLDGRSGKPLIHISGAGHGEAGDQTQPLATPAPSFLVLFFKKELLAFFLLARLDYGSTIKAAGMTLF
jgi:hypothetical protein